LAVAGYHAEMVGPRAEIGIHRFQRSGRLDPVVVKAVQTISELDTVRCGQAEADKTESDPMGACGNSRGRGHIHWTAIRRDALYMNDRGYRFLEQTGRVNHRYATVQREPDSASRVSDHRAVPADALGSSYSVGRPEFAN